MPRFNQPWWHCNYGGVSTVLDFGSILFSDAHGIGVPRDSSNLDLESRFQSENARQSPLLPSTFIYFSYPLGLCHSAPRTTTVTHPLRNPSPSFSERHLKPLLWNTPFTAVPNTFSVRSIFILANSHSIAGPLFTQVFTWKCGSKWWPRRRAAYSPKIRQAYILYKCGLRGLWQY